LPKCFINFNLKQIKSYTHSIGNLVEGISIRFIDEIYTEYFTNFSSRLLLVNSCFYYSQLKDYWF